MPITIGPLSFGDGGSGGRIGALLRQRGQTDRGLFLIYPGADESWHLRGVAREAAEPSVAATARLAHDISNYLDLTFADASDTREKKFMPLVGNDRNDFPEQVNEYNFTTIQWPAPVSEVKARLDYGDLRVTSRANGEAGNDDRLQVSIGTAATTDQNSDADIPLYNGTPGVLRAGEIRVTSPDRAQGGEYAAPPSYFILDRFSFRATERGTAGNALEFQIRSVVNTDQTEAETWTASYTDDTTLRVTVTFNSGVATERRTFTSSLFVAAFNAATDSNGGRPITLIDGFPSHSDSVNWRLATGTNAPFSGGTDVSGGGTPTNFGGIELVSSGPRSAAVQASTTWGNVVLTANAAGAFPNNGKYQAQVVGTNSGGHQFRVTRSDLTGGRHFQILLDSSVGSAPTVAQVIQGLNDADTEDLITASAAAGVSDTSVAWTGTGTQSFTGGADAVNPLAATWDADSHTLTITALDSDPASEVITAITALDEFSTSVGPGYVRLAGGGLTTGVINVDDTVGNTLSYAFEGGTDGRDRSTLTAVNRNDSDGDLLAITGLINGDTTQDILDAYSGNRFTLTSVSGDATTVFSNPVALGATPLSGGVSEVVRQNPLVYVSEVTDEAITYTIWYHGSQTPAGQRTTLTEMKAAWDNINEVDGLHGTSPQTAITGTGSNVIATIPGGPTGGADREDADILEAIARPDDEEHGPNVELRYDPAEENLQAIHDRLKAQGVVTVVAPFGTDLTANAEVPPFTRTMFLAAGVSESTGVTVEDEGTALTTPATTLDFVGSGVTATGTNTKKTITIPGGAFDLHEDVTTEATSLNANGLDRFLISREAETGDPNAYITAENVRNFAKGYVGTWASRPGGFIFRIGDITDHSNMWYVTKVQHTKKSNGPDTDPTNFISISTWGGAWAAGYFHVGTFVTHANEIWISNDVVLNSDPAPNDASNTKWTQISGSSSGSSPTSLAGLPIPAWASGSNYAAWVLIRDPHGRIYVTTQAITNSTIVPARSSAFQAIDGYEGAYADNTAYPAGAIVTDSSNDIYFVIAAVSTSNTTAPSASNSFVQINGGDGGGSTTLSDADPQPAGTAAAGTSTEASRADHVHAAELGDDVITPAMLDADSAADKEALRTRIGAVTARANPSEAVDGGDLTKLDIDGTIYEVPEGTFTLSDRIGARITGIGATAVQGPDFADLTPTIWLSFLYTRTNTLLRFNTMIRKQDIEGVVAGSAYRLQAQGAGGAYFSLYETGGKLTITLSDTTSIPLATLDVHNVKGASGSTGGGADLSLSDPQPLGTASPGTGTEASRSDHVHPTELVDDVITPAMLVADSAGEKTAMRTRIGAGTSNVGNNEIDARINPIARVGNTDRWPTNKLNTDVVLTAELTAAIAGFLSQTQVDARVAALVNALALASNTARWGKAKLPSDTVYDTDIANFRTAAQITTQINTALAGFSHWENRWDAGTAYTTGQLVRHNSAAYIALQAVAANSNAQTEPGVGSAWAASWYRLGYAAGAPNSLVTPTFDTNNGQLILTDRGGTAHRVTIPTGGTPVVANPSGTDGDDLDRLSVGGTNFNIPHFRPIQIGNADFGATTADNVNEFRAHVSGSGIDRPSSVPTGEWWALTSSDRSIAGDNLYIFPADAVPIGRAAEGAASPSTGAAVAISHSREIFLAWDAAGKLLVGAGNQATDINELTLFRMGVGDDPAADPGNLTPSVASFVSTSGDLSPAAGSIANEVYGASWAISQSDHIGSARIIGFKGTFNSANVSVLHAITAGNYAHGQSSFAIPSGINLAADETYTLRLQVFGEGITNPGNATQPAAYHDIVVQAHAPATANYQWGYAEQVDGETAAQTAARIAGWTAWADTDTTDGGQSTETDGTLNTSTGYSALAPDVSDNAGTNLFVFFLAVKSGEPKPTGWTGNGLDASGAFNAGVDDTVGATNYTFYILKSFLSRNHADGDIRYIPRTS